MRSLSVIANEIRSDWKTISVYAKPYLDAMANLDKITDPYYADSGEEIVLRFLCNAGAWRGENARRIKAELKGMIKA